ncbi:aldo/keto reductase [Candidatus Nitrosacidococcus tergens]|uniref:Putative oxidoreductase, aryl-alcohol dehydrogenase like protein n=1 Tax=Candidatus Nitrosacidococcus tergens TaxID=553981 RepID=A0A7G1Q7K3_9GAMM|nr:aldo/keto reductase [Candidatus Nitrosacidococcus tergens]CAB1274423.1 putative oxidoreductase, aryl-alcohol dehydrogenase like protein [Candidatus Nitrosacidococcus tergens]
MEHTLSIKNALLNGPLGFGTAPLGNMFRSISDDEAASTLEAAWAAGIRYFDTAPFYGAGLAEIRLGQELAKHQRNEYIISTKVGRVVLNEIMEESRVSGRHNKLFKYGKKNKIIFDYTADGVECSICGSLKRLGVDYIDFVWIHDLAQDALGDGWIDQFEIAHNGAMRVLDQLRDQGVIKGWGLGVNRVEPVELVLSLTDVHPDSTLLAGRYTLLDHERALQHLMPTALACNVQIVIGGPYNSGILVGGSHFEYVDAPPNIIARVKRLQKLTDRYSISIKAAALQFSLAHLATVAVIPGASKPERIQEDHDALAAKIPDEFWQDLRREGLVALNAPLPIDIDDFSR